ncbi:septation ring formation regulator EzrA [Bacillus dakarensis]|uniref:septation ring formation regulator EzrA n=1 Tax=Robertmurraya dakarensis TaxID=1926278 RepID=UPI0009812E82|nr:septation ring formation regulator EzrA [Bacillus dakarensis]
MEYIIGGLGLVLCLYIIGFFVKKKYYKEIDHYESWKIDIMNRPVIEQMSRVKALNMTGETEELFEKWRNEWDDIVTTQLPDVEEYLFDAEEFIDKYRFKKVKEVMSAIEEHLNEVEKKIKTLLEQINELVGSEEKNRSEIEELKESYRIMKKTLLAHRHNYGAAEAGLELKLNEMNTHFQEFEELTNHGDYLKARENVLFIQAMQNDIRHKLEVIPSLLVECQSKIPAQLHEIREGYREMVQQGYILDHVELDKEIEGIEEELTTFISSIEEIETDQVEKGVEEIKKIIDGLYDLFEEEVKAKQFIHVHEEETKEMLLTAQEANEMLKDEIEIVKQSYHISDNRLQEQNALEEKLHQLFSRFELLEHKIQNDEMAYSILKEELNGIRDQLEEIHQELINFDENLKTLRKDELAAREKVQELTKKIAESIKLVSKNNVPGLSKDYLELLQDAKESIENVKIKLEEQPLDIPTVQKYLDIAVMTVDRIFNATTEIVETVRLVEKVIQYGNRYRSRYASVDEGLKEAEQSFRGYDYHSALEQAASAIEEIEPGALKKIESILSEKK